MEGECHLLPQKSDSSVPSARCSGASPMISKGRGGEENNKQLTTGDNSLTFSNTNEQKISINRALTESRIRRRPTTTPRAPPTSRFLSDPICLRRGGVRFRTTGCLQFSPYTERTVGVACNYIPTPQSDNPLLDSAEIAWSRLPVTVELTRQEGTQTTRSEAEKCRDRKVPLAQLRRGPRRSNSDGFFRKTSSVTTPCTTATTAPLRTRGKDTWSSARRDARGKPLTAGTPRNYAAGGDVCTDFVVRRSSSNEKPTSHLFFSSGCGSNYVCSCCTHEELQPERVRVLEVPPPGDTHLGSAASGQPLRGRGSLESIPLGRVAALKTELERWMHKEKQRRGRNRMKTAQPAAASGATNDEKKVWQQTCSRTRESLHERTDTATLMPGVDCKNAKGALRKQSARATETASRPVLLACPSLLTSVECLSSRKAADNFFVLYRSETSRSSACRHFGSAHPANQCSARSDNGIYHSRPCKEETVFSNGTKQTTPVPKTKTLRQDTQCNTWSSKKTNADRPDKTRHRCRLTQEHTASSLGSASPGVDTEPQKEITPALDLQNTQDLIRHETDGSLWTTRAETEEHTGAPAATPLTLQSHLTDRPLEGKTMPVEETYAPPFSRDVPGDQETTTCDSRGFSPRPSAERCSTDNQLLCLSTAKTLARRPPHIPRLELAKVHELRDALYHPLLLSSSSKNSRFVPDSRLTSSRKPHAYPSIRTEHDREATAARIAKAYFTMDEEPPAGRCPIVKLVERPVSQDGLRQRQRSCLSQGFCLPARSRVVRCSPNLFTARVCTILKKQLHAEDVNAAGTRQHSQQAFNAPNPRNEKSIAADEREGSCSPAGKGVGKEAERDELFCAHHTIRKMLTHYHPSTMSQSEQFFAGCCNFNMPLTSDWFSPTRPPSSTSSVSRCSDPANAVDTKEGEELGHSAPLKGEPVACVRSTSVCNIKAQHRPSRKLGGPRLCCGISVEHSKRRCHSSGQTSDQNSSRALNMRYKVSNGQPKERTIDRVGNSGRPAEESGRVKLCATEHILNKMCEGCSDRVQDRSFCHTLVPAFHRPLRGDHQGGKAATRDHKKQQPPANSTAVTFYKYGFAAGAATFMKRRRLALLHHKHSETGYYSDVAGKSLSAERPSAQGQGGRTQMSSAHYTGASFF